MWLKYVESVLLLYEISSTSFSKVYRLRARVKKDITLSRIEICPRRHYSRLRIQ